MGYGFEAVIFWLGSLTISLLVLYFVIKTAVVHGIRHVLRILGTEYGLAAEDRTRAHLDGLVERVRERLIETSAVDADLED